MSPQARIKIQEDITVYYHSKYGTAPSEKNVMGTFDSNKPTVYANFSEEDLPTLTSDSAKFLGWYLDQAFTIPVTVGNMEVSSVYNDDYKLNLYAKWQETIYIIESETLTGLANAVRTKTGASGAMTPAVIGETFEAWEIKDKSVELIEGTLTNYENSSLSGIVNGAFAYCTNLVSASFLNCVRINPYAFYYCSNLNSINFPACSYIDYLAFLGCSRLVDINFPSCYYIGASTFKDCSSLTYVDFPTCTSMSNNAFENCSSLISANFPVCSRINFGAAFYNCRNLVSVNLPICNSIGSSTFYNCSNLTSISLPFCVHISNSAFYNCHKLESVYLASSSMCALQNVNAFSNTPISLSSYTGEFGSIYVPASLVETYRAATNWATYSSRITSIV